MGILNVHYGVAFVIVFGSLAAIFWAPARRYVLYVLILQVVLGVVVWGVTKLVPPPIHWTLAILNGGTYAMATAMERKGRPRPVILALLTLGAIVFAYVFSVGMHALKAGAA